MAEPHFASQYRLVYDKYGRKLVDFVGKVENIKEEYESIRQRFDFQPLPHSNKAASLTGKNWMDYYTPFTACQEGSQLQPVAINKDSLLKIIESIAISIGILAH